MHTQLSYVRRGLFATIVVAMLTACGAASVPGTAAPSPVAAASTAATSAAQHATNTPSAAASRAPSASAPLSPEASAEPSASAVPDAAGNVLPAPLLFLREGQIVRMERDGKTITAITNEQPGQSDILAVINFDVSSVDGSLVYVVQGRDGNMLIRTDAQGQQRTVLLPSAAVNNPHWSPDGAQIALQISDPPEGMAGLTGGVYLLPANGGELQLLQASDRYGANVSPEARGFSPHAWSPDGKKLLLVAYALGVEVCNAAVKDLASGELVTIQAPEGMVSGCASGQWSVDGQTIFIGMNRPGPQPPVPGLWQADPQTGAIKQFIQGDGFETGGYQLVTNQRPLKDGSVYAFMSTVETLPDPFSGVLPRYKLFLMGQTDGLALRDEEFTVVGQALWADDNSGVIVDMPEGSIGDVATSWIPLDGGPVVELSKFVGEVKHWGRN